MALLAHFEPRIGQREDTSGNKSETIPVSDIHHIALSQEHRQLLEHPIDDDVSIVTIFTKMTPQKDVLKQGELVVAGKETRIRHPITVEYPIHFKKTYFRMCFNADPAEEFMKSEFASEILGYPPPLAYSERIFRTNYMPNKPYSRLSPFTNIEPQHRNIKIAKESPCALLLGLWVLLEEAFSQLDKLHCHGMAHGDLELHNILISFSPPQAYLIDFESAILKDRVSPQEWEQACRRDQENIFREAIFIQSAIGQQDGKLAALSLERLPELFREPAQFENHIRGLGTLEI